ncbi:hypothetical protein ACET3Z_027924 [Daucus carota]
MELSNDDNTNLSSPFGQMGQGLSESELRETCYEILIGACRSAGGSRPLTYVSSSVKRNVEKQPSISLQRSVSSVAASKMKRALGLKKAVRGDSSRGGDREVTIGELMRVQMRVSEQTDSRVRRGLLRIAATQLGRRIESVVLPLELLQQFNSSDFPTEKEYAAWQQRNLKVLEAGLLKHPYLPLDKNNTSAQQLRRIVHKSLKRPIETGKHSESMQILRDIVMSLACRSNDGTHSEICHWADGIPLNLRLYQILLEACFDINDATSVIEEVDEVLELIKKTWVILGINQTFHNLCFSWVFFHHYVATGQVENDLLFAANNLLLDVEKDARVTKDPVYSKTLSSTMTTILNWAEKKLLLYQNNFFRGNIDVMESVLSFGVLTANILEDISHNYKKRSEIDVALDRVDAYIRSSLRKAFSEARDRIYLSRRSAKHQQNSPPFLCILAQEIIDLAYNEKEIYSPILKRWHPLATGVAVATLHACYGKELKQFVSVNSELTPDNLQVLIAADKLEKDLVHMAVEDSVDSEDGGKSIIQEMTPYEAEGVIANLIKSWTRTRIESLKESVDRNLQQETWNLHSNKDQIASSAAAILRTANETLEGFFMLPIPQHSASLSDLINGLDRCFQQYILTAKFGCGSRSDFIPALPVLTRCTAGSKLPGLFRKKDKLIQRRKSQGETTDENDYFGIRELCVRINSFHHIRKCVDVLEKKTVDHLKNNGSTHLDNTIVTKFDLSRATCVEGVQSLCMATAYKIVFQDLSHVLWDGLYIGEVSSSRIQPFLKELEQYLEIIASTVHDRVRTRLITDVMKAAFDGFLLVLLAGGPSRAFNVHDSAVIEEDFRLLTDLFWSGGDGLPTDLIEKFASTVRFVLPLFRTETESLIEEFKSSIMEEFGTSAKSRLPLPPTSGQWDPNESNTILRVLCHRNDKLATNFLKKAYNLPKEL